MNVQNIIRDTEFSHFTRGEVVKMMEGKSSKVLFLESIKIQRTVFRILSHGNSISGFRKLGSGTKDDQDENMMSLCTAKHMWML